MERRIKEWKGFLSISEKEFFVKFKRRFWYKVLVGEELILIPFDEDWEPMNMEELEDEEWEYMGEILTVWENSERKVRLVIFRRR